MIENQGTHGRKIVTIYDDIYDLPDCRAYYRAMDLAGFRTAHFAAAAFRAVMVELKRQRALPRIDVVDFASGYGIAAALMRHDITLDDVLARYRDDRFDDAATGTVIAADREWFADSRRADELDRYFGIDIAGNALAYGQSVGIFDAVFPENLQDDTVSDELSAALAETDLIVECGSVAHMLPGALDQMLSVAVRAPWVAMAPIRGNDTQEAMDVLANHGLVVERLPLSPFPHRRFSNADEQARAIANAQNRGYDTTGFETNGYFHAQIFLARPATDATPVDSWPVSPIP